MKNLQGQDALDKANKLMESLMVTQKVDSYSNVESIHLGYDGKHYGVIKENTKYVLKVSNEQNPLLTEDFDYINGVQNKARYSKSSYNDIMKHFNLMNIEFRRQHGDSLMTETLEEKKFVISTKKKSKEPNLDSFDDTEFPEDDALTSSDGEDMSNSEEFDDTEFDEMGGEESGSESPDDYADVDPDDLDTDDPEKMIQKLSGKLAYELRDYDDEDKYSDTAKFAMSMTTSALQVDKMSDEDKNAIEAKIDGKFDSPSNDDESGEDIDLGEMVVGKVIMNKAQFLGAIIEGYDINTTDALTSWANNLANMFNNGKIDNSMDLLKIIENNIEDHDMHVDFLKLKMSFEKHVLGSKITPELIKSIVQDSMPKPSYEEEDEDMFFEGDLSEDVGEDVNVDKLINRDWTVAAKKFKLINWLLNKSKKDSDGNPVFSTEDMSKVWSGIYGKSGYSDYFYKLPSDFRNTLRNTLPNSKYKYAEVNGKLMPIDTVYRQAGVFDVRDNGLYNSFKQQYNALVNDTVANVDEDIYFEVDDVKTADDIYNVDSDKILFDEDEDIETSGNQDNLKLSDIDFETLRRMYYKFIEEVEADKLNSAKSNSIYSGSRPWGSGLIHHLRKLFDFLDYYKFDIKGIDYDIKYTLKSFEKNQNSLNNNKKFNNAFSEIVLLKDKLKHLSEYKFNYWQKQLYDDNTREDKLAKSIYTELDKKFTEINQLSDNIKSRVDILKKKQSSTVNNDSDVFDESDSTFSEKPKKINNSKYVQNYFGMDVGRVRGDDDATEYLIELEDEVEQKPNKKGRRNPFKYRK